MNLLQIECQHKNKRAMSSKNDESIFYIELSSFRLIKSLFDYIQKSIYKDKLNHQNCLY